jgi:hypothetical protein
MIKKEYIDLASGFFMEKIFIREIKRISNSHLH